MVKKICKFSRFGSAARFTLVEVLVVAAIIGFAIGLALPSLGRSLMRAKQVRWLAYNANLNSDPATVLNFNFRDIAMKSYPGGSPGVAAINMASGCGAEGFEPVKYDGFIRNNAEIRERSGRWASFNPAVKFDGLDGHIEIPGRQVFNVQGSMDDFTILIWCNFDTLSGRQVLVSRSVWDLYSSFALYLDSGKIVLESGMSDISFTPADLQAGKWVHIAAVGSSGSGISLFYNGKLVGSESYGNPGNKIVVWHVPPGRPEQARLLVVGAPAWNGLQNQGGSYIVSTDPESYFRNYNNGAISNAPVIIGAANMNSGTSPLFFFKGRMDELVLAFRAYKPEDISRHYQVGNPY